MRSRPSRVQLLTAVERNALDLGKIETERTKLRGLIATAVSYDGTDIAEARISRKH